MENGNADPIAESTLISEEDEEFYENLEAPKFIDLTAPDLAQPDDASWFCLKIGCDQNHEQVDPEGLHKSFVLRVMAARSPNVRLHKALNRSNRRLNANCPHSAPAKQPSRLVRLSTATEVPDKLANSKLKSHLISQLKSPQSKKMPLTTIGEKETTFTPQKQDVSSKNQPASGGKNGSAFFSAKQLFSPHKKEIKEVCSKLRKLNLNNSKRRSVPSRYLGQVSKASSRSDRSKPNDSNLKQEKEIAPSKNISRPLWRKQQQLLEENSQNLGSDVASSEGNSQLNSKKESLRPTRKSSRPIRKRSVEHHSKNEVESKESGEILDLKSEMKENASASNTTKENMRPTRRSSRLIRKESAEHSSKSEVENNEGGEVLVPESETKEKFGASNTNMKQKLETGPKRKGSRPLWKSNQRILKSNAENGTTSSTENEEAKEEGSQSKMDNLGTGIEKDGLTTIVDNCDSMRNGAKEEGSQSKMDNLGTGIEKDGLTTIVDNCDSMRNGAKNEEFLKKEGSKSKTKDKSETRVGSYGLKTKLKNCDENKENVVQHDAKRADIRKKVNAEGKKSSLLRAIENVPPQQVLKLKKPSQVNADQGAKNKKTTNPKPFRLRTDERGILKEANLEKKRLVHSDTPKESKGVQRKDAGTERCKGGRIIPSKFQCLNKGPTSLASKGKNAPPLHEKKQKAVENTDSIRVGVKKISCSRNTRS